MSLISRRNLRKSPVNVGVWRYGEFLEAIADPKHEQHDDFVEWAGEFDPEQFEAGKTTKAMRRGLPVWRQCR